MLLKGVENMISLYIIKLKEEIRKQNLWLEEKDGEDGGFAIGRRIYDKQEIDVSYAYSS